MKIIEKIINAFLMSRNHAVKVSNVICLTGCDGKFTGIDLPPRLDTTLS